MFGPQSNHRALFCLVVLSAFVGGCTMAVTADTNVTLSVEDSVSTPTETIEYEGETYEVDATTVREPGNAFTAKATLPEKEYTNLKFQLYNSDKQIEASKGVYDPNTSETTTFEATFETDNFTPGTYILNLVLDGSTKRVQPVVIAGYEVTMTHPNSPSREEDIEITAEVAQSELSSAPAGVEAVIWTESQSKTFEMTQDGEETYTTTVALDQFETGEYTINVAAQGNETFRGQKEVLGLESSTITIQGASSDASTDESSSGGDGGSDSDDTAGDGTADNNTTENTTESTGSESTSSNDTDSDPAPSSGDDDTPSGTDNTTDDDSSGVTNGTDGSEGSDTANSDENVIEPNENSSSENTDDQVTLFAVQGVFLLVVVVVSVRRLRS